MEAQEPADLITENANSADRFNNLVAVTIAILAIFMGIFKIKDDNICQAMQQAQADRIDNWGWYQSHKTRAEFAAATVTQLELLPETPAKTQAVTSWKTTVANQTQKANEVKAKAEDAEKTYDRWNFRDDQFDMADAALAMAIAMLAVSVLAKRLWLYVFALLPVGFGLLMGLSGLFGWSIHPDFLAKFLGA